MLNKKFHDRHRTRFAGAAPGVLIQALGSALCSLDWLLFSFLGVQHISSKSEQLLCNLLRIDNKFGTPMKLVSGVARA